MNKLLITGKVKEINIESRTLTAYASTADMDRDGEVISPDAWRKTIQQFQSVPLIWAHDYRIPPIGRATDFEIDGRGLKFRAEFATTEFANEIWGLYRDKYLNSFSVGFIPKQATEGQQRHEPARTFTEAELLEISAVAVPANPFATVERGVPIVAFKSVDSFTHALSDTSDEAHIEPDNADPDDVATPAELDELTPDQADALAQTLSAVVEELTDYLHGD